MQRVAVHLLEALKHVQLLEALRRVVALPLGRARHDPLDRLRRPLLGDRRHLLEHALQVARRLEAGDGHDLVQRAEPGQVGLPARRRSGSY